VEGIDPDLVDAVSLGARAILVATGGPTASGAAPAGTPRIKAKIVRGPAI